MHKRSILALAVTGALAALIAVLTLTKVDVPPMAPTSDKVQHMLAFAALAFPIALLQPRWLWIAIPLFALFGGAIEIIQPYVDRSRDLNDWVADMIGVGAGSALGLILSLWIRSAKAKVQTRPASAQRR